ncbi:hypothetical protein F9C07_6850 [Aspergillus flavus]|uniref:Uncharacterized protein n=1 Tax=Aspergillus flavus (strain ATCC 200026 / FGSC A1120 / IAM 13836 / NRRL 3357 / JCM 12722 / SRRC 167) TaxID=332952 RepID=A0A7U2QSU7_ASPFN|nr:hypothetical protein F9C07_6850 [Aspergillus flavus]
METVMEELLLNDSGLNVALDEARISVQVLYPNFLLYQMFTPEEVARTEV